MKLNVVLFAVCGGEYQLTKGILDEYYEYENEGETQRHILQFYDCFFHGCPTCYRINGDKPIGNSKDTLDARMSAMIL